MDGGEVFPERRMDLLDGTVTHPGVLLCDEPYYRTMDFSRISQRAPKIGVTMPDGITEP
jgi:hypothetical protein